MKQTPVCKENTQEHVFVGEISRKKLDTIFSILLLIKTYFVHVWMAPKTTVIYLYPDIIPAPFKIVIINLETLSEF